MKTSFFSCYSNLYTGVHTHAWLWWYLIINLHLEILFILLFWSKEGFLPITCILQRNIRGKMRRWSLKKVTGDRIRSALWRFAMLNKQTSTDSCPQDSVTNSTDVKLPSISTNSITKQCTQLQKNNQCLLQPPAGYFLLYSSRYKHKPFLVPSLWYFWAQLIQY